MHQQMNIHIAVGTVKFDKSLQQNMIEMHFGEAEISFNVFLNEWLICTTNYHIDHVLHPHTWARS
jgi:hypothetical protein